MQYEQGEGDVFIAGGVESMSSGAILHSKGRGPVLLRESDGLGYRLGLAVPESKFQGAIRNGIDG